MANHHQRLLDEVRTARQLPSPESAKLIRKSAGVSQERMAKELHVNRTTLIRWESGAIEPRLKQRVRYANLLAALQREIED